MRRWISFPLIIIVLSITGWAQNVRVDSLQQVIEETNKPDELAKTYLALTEVYIHLDPNKGRASAQDALIAAEAARNKLLLAKAYNALGLIDRYQGDLEASQRYHTRALIELEGVDSPDELSTTHRQLGAAFHRQGKWDMAWEQYTYALQIAEVNNLIHLKCYALNNMGAIRRMQGNLEEALAHYQNALDLINEAPTPPPILESNLANNVANIYMQEGRTMDALNSYEKVYDIRLKSGDSVGVVKVLFNIAKCYQRIDDAEPLFKYVHLGIALAKRIGLQPELLGGYHDLTYAHMNYGELDSSLHYSQISRRLAQTTVNKKAQAETFLSTGHVFDMMGVVDSALWYAHLTERMADTLGDQAMRMRVYDLLKGIYLGEEQYKLAYIYRDMEARMADSIFRVGNTFTAQLEAKQAINQQEHEIAHLYLEKRIQRNWWAAATVCSILIALAIFMYLRVRSQRQVNQLLEEKNEAIRYQNYQLSIHNADLEQFAFAVSHNMREPLRTLGSYAGLVKKRYEEKLDEDGQAFLGFISGSAQHLHNLLADLLIYVQLGKRPIHIVQVDLNSLMKKVKGRLTNQIQAEKAEIRIEPLPLINGDPDSLFLLFQHLMQNALTFHEHMPPVVEVTYKAGRDYHLFGIRDNGLGVPAEQRQKIFQLFQRLHTYKSETGTGIGLAICQKVVQQHQGQIWVTENPDLGSTFWVKIPQEFNPIETESAEEATT